MPGEQQSSPPIIGIVATELSLAPRGTANSERTRLLVV
jgi:hypothetical protein